MDSTTKNIVTTVLTALLGAVATLGAAYIGKADFNPAHRSFVTLIARKYSMRCLTTPCRRRS